MSGVEPASRTVGHQIHVRAWRSFTTDSLEQDGEDGVTETSALVLREHRHVDHVEVPTSIAKQSPHTHCLGIELVQNMHRGPASSERGLGLILSAR